MNIFTISSKLRLALTTVALVLVALAFQLMLSVVGEWEPSGFGVTHSVYITYAVLLFLGLIGGAWLSIPGGVEPLSARYRTLWRGWPLGSRRLVLGRIFRQCIGLTAPTLVAVLVLSVMLGFIDDGAAWWIHVALGVGLSVLVFCSIWCSIIVGVWLGRSTVTLLTAVILGLMLPNGFANSVPEAAGIVLVSLIATVVVLTAVLSSFFWKWFRGFEG